MQEAGHTCERGLPQDTCVTVVLEFDTQGRLIVATDYFACGKSVLYSGVRIRRRRDANQELRKTPLPWHEGHCF